VEVAVALGVGSIVGAILLYALVQGVWLFRANESEMWARNEGSSVIRVIRDDIQAAQDVRIYSDYTNVGGTESQNGSCAVIDLPDGSSVSYYRSPVTPLVSGSGVTDQIYYHADGSTAPDPATDKLLSSGVLNFEFRRNPNGTVRVAFILGIFGYPRHLLGTVESDRLRFTTSAIPRNP
jgi:hypothetical protein